MPLLPPYKEIGIPALDSQIAEKGSSFRPSTGQKPPFYSRLADAQPEVQPRFDELAPVD
jgi:hypothetical protein